MNERKNGASGTRHTSKRVANSSATPTTSRPGSPPTAATAIRSNRADTGWSSHVPARGQTAPSSSADCSASKTYCRWASAARLTTSAAGLSISTRAGVDPVLKIPRLQDAYFARVPGLPPRHHGARDRRDRDRAGGHQRLPADHPRLLDANGQSTTAKARRTCTRSRCATRSTRWPTSCSATSTTASTAAVSPAPRRRTTRPTTGCSPASTGSPTVLHRQRYLVGDTITEADVRLFTTLARFDPSITATSSATAANSARCRCCGPTRAICSRHPDSATPSTSRRSKQHYYIVHTDINPTRNRAQGTGLDRLARPARPRTTGRPTVRRRHTASPAHARRKWFQPSTGPPDRSRRLLPCVGAETPVHTFGITAGEPARTVVLVAQSLRMIVAPAATARSWSASAASASSTTMYTEPIPGGRSAMRRIRRAANRA